MKLIYIDVETTGLDPKTCAIWQLSGIIEIDGKEVEQFNFFIKPDPDQNINIAALEATNYSLEKLVKAQLRQEEAYKKFVYMLESYINKYDKTDKFYLIGYNSHSFDSNFIRTLFERNDNPYYGAYFWFPSIDVMLMAAFASIGQRNKLPDFKLLTVAKSLGIEVDETKAHDAMYDVQITKEIYKILDKEYNAGLV